jgi:hypothetical protein
VLLLSTVAINVTEEIEHHKNKIGINWNISSCLLLPWLQSGTAMADTLLLVFAGAILSDITPRTRQRLR